MAVGKRFRLGIAPGEDQAAHLIEVRPGFRVHLRIGTAGPQRVLIELEPLALRAPEDHRPEPPVADRQGFGPFAGGGVVPEFQVGHQPLVRRRSPAGENASTLPGWLPTATVSPAWMDM